MRIKPIVLDRIQTNHTSFTVDLQLPSNVTFICGESGVGKSALYSFLQEYAAEEKRMVCLNYLDKNKKYRTSIKNSKGKLFVIDNADILLDDILRRYIGVDDKNQYIIIGRNPTGLLLQQNEIMELETKKVGDMISFSLKKSM